MLSEMAPPSIRRNVFARVENAKQEKTKPTLCTGKSQQRDAWNLETAFYTLWNSKLPPSSHKMQWMAKEDKQDMCMHPPCATLRLGWPFKVQRHSKVLRRKMEDSGLMTRWWWCSGTLYGMHVRDHERLRLLLWCVTHVINTIIWFVESRRTVTSLYGAPSAIHSCVTPHDTYNSQINLL